MKRPSSLPSSHPSPSPPPLPDSVFVVVLGRVPRTLASARRGGTGVHRPEDPTCAGGAAPYYLVGSTGPAACEAWDLFDRAVVPRTLAWVCRGGGGPPRALLVVRQARRHGRRPLRSSRAGATAPVTAESWDLSVACMLSSHGSAEAPCSRRQMLGAASRGDRRVPKLLRRSRQSHLNQQSYCRGSAIYWKSSSTVPCFSCS